MAAIDSARISLATGIAVLGLKFLAYYWTGSVALYSDALESFVNVAGALAALAALIVAIRPADSRHPYGHAKAEYFSAVFEGVLIVVAALTIIQESWPRLFHPQAVTGLDWGIAASILASTLNAALARYLVHQGDRLSSPALRADGLHIWSDVVTSVGVLIGIGLAVWTGWWLLDPLLAVLVALNILWVGGGLIRDSLGGLMDESLPEEDLTRVKTLVKDAMTGA
ncbi:MAG: cation diffusion facilitator family transporter, partial [Pseudomonadota bacterium]